MLRSMRLALVAGAVMGVAGVAAADPTWSVLYNQTTASSGASSSVRGIAVSSDNTTVYASYLQASATFRQISGYNSTTGAAVHGPHFLPNQADASSGREQARGLATDDRGNVYYGSGDREISGTSNLPYFRVMNTSLSAPVSGRVNTSGDAVTQAKRFGGVATYQSGANYYMYATRESGSEGGIIQRWDVTNASAPVLDSTFGTAGTLFVNTLPGGALSADFRGLSIAADGTIYACQNYQGALSGTSRLWRIDSGLTGASSILLDGAFDVALYGSNAYVSTYRAGSSGVGVVDLNTFLQTGTFLTGFTHSNTSTDSGYSGIDIDASGRIFLADQLYASGSTSDRILVSSAVPAPGLCGLLGLSGLIAIRRRRR